MEGGLVRQLHYRLRMSLAAVTIGTSQPPPVLHSEQRKPVASRQDGDATAGFRRQFDSASAESEKVDVAVGKRHDRPLRAEDGKVRPQPAAKKVTAARDTPVESDEPVQQVPTAETEITDSKPLAVEAQIARWAQPALAASLVELLTALEHFGPAVQPDTNLGGDAEPALQSGDGRELPKALVSVTDFFDSLAATGRLTVEAPQLAQPVPETDAGTVPITDEIAAPATDSDTDVPKPVLNVRPVESGQEQRRSLVSAVTTIPAAIPNRPPVEAVSTEREEPLQPTNENVARTLTSKTATARSGAPADIPSAHFKISPKTQNPQDIHSVVHRPITDLFTAFSTGDVSKTPVAQAIDDSDALVAQQLVDDDANWATALEPKATAVSPRATAPTLGRVELESIVEDPEFDLERRAREFAGRRPPSKTKVLSATDDDAGQINPGRQALETPNPETAAGERRLKRPADSSSARQSEVAPNAARPSAGRAPEAGREVSAPAQRSVRTQPTELPRAVEKIIEAAQVERRSGLTRMNIVIQDQSIGRVAIRMVERAGTVDTMIRANTPVTAQRISDQIPLLLESLSEKGMQTHSAAGGNLFDEQEGAGSQRQQQRDQQGRRQPHRRDQDQPQFQVETD